MWPNVCFLSSTPYRDAAAAASKLLGDSWACRAATARPAAWPPAALRPPLLLRAAVVLGEAVRVFSGLVSGLAPGLGPCAVAPWGCGVLLLVVRWPPPGGLCIACFIFLATAMVQTQATN